MLIDRVKFIGAILLLCIAVLGATAAGIALITHIEQQMIEAAGRLDQPPEQW